MYYSREDKIIMKVGFFVAQKIIGDVLMPRNCLPYTVTWCKLSLTALGVPRGRKDDRLQREVQPFQGSNARLRNLR